jgi:hypothetical protein
VYCVNEYRDSSGPIATLEWQMAPEGIRIVEPGGNSITSLRSHRTRCPPRVGSNLPRAVIAHQPNGRLAKSTWSKQHVFGPKLNVAQANTLLRKLRLRRGYVLKRGPR